MILRIGVTGHRSLEQVKALRKGVFRVLLRLGEIFPDAEWVVVSSLAEGADRLVVKLIWQQFPQAHLVVPLPLPVQDYLEDFSTQHSRDEFLALLQRASQVNQPNPGATRPQAYAQAGAWMVTHSQVLIALWDGAAARGKGGTGEMVALAQVRGLPLAWVYARNCEVAPDQATAPVKQTGHVMYQRFSKLTG